MSHAENRGDYFDFKAPRTPEEDDTKKTGDWSTSFGREDSSVSGEINKKLSPDKELTQQIDIRDIPLNPPKKEKVVFLDMNPKNPKRLEDWFTFVKLQGWGELLKNETVERLNHDGLSIRVYDTSAGWGYKFPVKF